MNIASQHGATGTELTQHQLLQGYLGATLSVTTHGCSQQDNNYSIGAIKVETLSMSATVEYVCHSCTFFIKSHEFILKSIS